MAEPFEIGNAQGIELQELPEDWDRALAVVAHPDDMEYGAASAVARWTAQAKDVRYLLVTKGEAGISSLPPDEVGPARMAEQIASCAIVGVTDVEFLDHPDGLLEANLALRRDLAAAIRKNKPDVLLSINFREGWGGPSWNHVDHRVIGVALLDAVRDAANPWLFADLGLEPWSGVQFVAFGGSPFPTHAVDVTETIEAGIESLKCHALYLANLGGSMADPADFLRSNAREAGRQIGVKLATTFEVLRP